MFREMRRNKQALSEEECREILGRCTSGTLAVLGDGGYPYAVPLSYVFNNGHIYFHCARSGHKLDAVRACDKVSFCVLDEGQRNEGDWWYTFRSVVIFGRARLLEDGPYKTEIMTELGRKYMPTEEEIIDDIARNGHRTAIIELTVEHMTGKRVKEK